MNGYQYDVFISYRRAGNVANWVQLHLSRVLARCLEDELDRAPVLFIDNDMETGSRWPDKLETSLRQSRLMIAVLSPPYFTSPWCVAEWRSMFLRERVLELNGGLILPLVFSDGDKFPDDARTRKPKSMKEWGYPYPQFADSPAFLSFHDAVRQLAGQIARQLETVPAWDANWPVERPDAVLAPMPAALPEL
jgi:hypothetical protein